MTGDGKINCVPRRAELSLMMTVTVIHNRAEILALRSIVQTMFNE